MQGVSRLGRVAITGATGFIGRHLVRALLEDGCRPLLLTRASVDDGACERFPYDLSDREPVPTLARLGSVQTLFHLAGIRKSAEGTSTAQACAEQNGLATLRLLEAALATRVRRIVIVGSAAEYGDQPGPLHEELPLRPSTAYGASKAMATWFARALFESSGCPVVVVRPFTVYGPGQPADMFVAEAVRHAVAATPYRMSHGRHRQDLVHVDDVVRALVAAATVPGIEGTVINVGSGMTYELRYVAERVWAISGTRAPLQIGARPAPPASPHDPVADMGRARRLLNWHPEVDLEAGLAATIRAASGRDS